MLPPAEGTGNLCFLLSWEDPLELEQLLLTPPILPPLSCHPSASTLPGLWGSRCNVDKALGGKSKEPRSCFMWKTTAEKAACSPLCLAALASPPAPEPW